MNTTRPEKTTTRPKGRSRPNLKRTNCYTWPTKSGTVGASSAPPCDWPRPSPMRISKSHPGPRPKRPASVYFKPSAIGPMRSPIAAPSIPCSARPIHRAHPGERGRKETTMSNNDNNGDEQVKRDVTEMLRLWNCLSERDKEIVAQFLELLDRYATPEEGTSGPGKFSEFLKDAATRIHTLESEVDDFKSLVNGLAENIMTIAMCPECLDTTPDAAICPQCQTRREY